MCELNRIVRPAAPSSCSRSIICSRCRGSMPLNGSSRTSTCGSCTSAAATRVRCRIPLEYVSMRRSCASVISTRDSARRAAASGSGNRCSLALASTNSQAVRNPCTASRSLTRPRIRYTDGLRQAGAPATVTVPRDGGRKPAIMCSRVVLPAPFGPSSPVTPGPRVMVMLLTATTLPYQRDTLDSSIVVIGWPPSGIDRAAGWRSRPRTRPRPRRTPVRSRRPQWHRCRRTTGPRPAPGRPG